MLLCGLLFGDLSAFPDSVQRQEFLQQAGFACSQGTHENDIAVIRTSGLRAYFPRTTVPWAVLLPKLLFRGAYSSCCPPPFRPAHLVLPVHSNRLASQPSLPVAAKPSGHYPTVQEEPDSDVESIADSILSEDGVREHLNLDSDDDDANDIKRTYKLRVGIMEGTTFLNDYIVIDTLGRGSYGKVKLCLNVGDDCLYAVKVVDKRVMTQVAKSRTLQKGVRRASLDTKIIQRPPNPLEDLQREIQIMRSITHPNLVKLFEVIDDREAGKLLMVVDYCEGGALVRPGQLNPERPLPEAIAQFYFRQMAEGLATLHAAGVVHGDLKPENILLSGDSSVKIADFGQSRIIQGVDLMDCTVGTPAYLAPEICAGEPYSGKSADMWAMGVSLYVFMYGKEPYSADSIAELYERIATEPVQYPENVPVSLELQDLLGRLLCRMPEKRLTAEELIRHPWVVDEDWSSLLPGIYGGGDSMYGDEGTTLGDSPSSPTNLDAAQVAAVVFPEMQSVIDGGASASTSTSMMVPQPSSVVDALARANTKQNAFALHPSKRLHPLARDSMIWGSSADVMPGVVGDDDDKDEDVHDEEQEKEGKHLKAIDENADTSGPSFSTLVQKQKGPEDDAGSAIVDTKEDCEDYSSEPHSGPSLTFWRQISRLSSSAMSRRESSNSVQPMAAPSPFDTMLPGLSSSSSSHGIVGKSSAVSVEAALEFMSFQPGDVLPLKTPLNGSPIMYYIDQGVVELHWEAVLPVALSTVLTSRMSKAALAATETDTPKGTAAPASTAPSHNEFDTTGDRLNYLETLDSVIAGTRIHYLGPRSSHEELERATTSTLITALHKATERAETLLENASLGGVDNLLVSTRGQQQFCGILSMLDEKFLADKWRASIVAKEEVHAIMMTRDGLDVFLTQNPLAQVHLRAGMAKTRAEVTRLEALERIAEVQHRKNLKILKHASWKQKRAAAEAAAAYKQRVSALSRNKEHSTLNTASHETFALVKRLRDTLKEGLLPLPAGYGG